MATFLGTHVTDFDSQPFDVVDARLHGGLIRTISCVDEVPDTANGDVLILARIPIDAVVKSVRSGNDALGAGTMDLGLYKKNADGTYTAVDDNCFADAIAVTGANALTDVTYEAGATLIADRNKPAWQRANLSTRPEYGDLYLAATFDVGTSSIATLIVEMDYTV